MHSTSTAVGAAILLSLALIGAVEAKPLRLVSTNAQTLSAKDAGIRYGEAAGAVLVCQSLRITPRVADLRGRYQGADLEEFDSQAGKILKAWQESLSCQHANAPIDCMISQRWSCQQALREIGPSGTAVRGLVEPKE